jgi:hypothetical protein
MLPLVFAFLAKALVTIGLLIVWYLLLGSWTACLENGHRRRSTHVFFGGLSIFLLTATLVALSLMLEH